MFKLMDKKIFAILRKYFLLNWPYVFKELSITSSFDELFPVTIFLNLSQSHNTLITDDVKFMRHAVGDAILLQKQKFFI